MDVYVMLINGTVQGVFPTLKAAARAFESCIFDLPSGFEKMVETAKAEGKKNIECRIAKCSTAQTPEGTAFVNYGNETLTEIDFNKKQVPPPAGAKVVLAPEGYEDDPTKLN